MLVGNYDYAGTQKFRLHILRDEESDVTLCGIDTLKRKGNWEWTQSEGDKDCGCAHCNRKAAQQSMHADQKRAANSNVYLHLPLLAGDTSRWADSPLSLTKNEE